MAEPVAGVASPQRAISVVVPTCDPERLAPLVDSLARQTTAFELITVDNGSRLDGAAAMTSALEHVEVVRLEENVGFSRAVNLGAERAAGDVLVLLNDDCVCEPGFLEAIAGAVDPGASTIMAAAVLRDPHRPDLIDSAGMDLDPTLLVFDYLNGAPVELVGPGTPDPIGPSAAAAAFDRAAFRAVGGFDERIFAYWEDVDLVLRLRREGGTCALARGARGEHQHSATLGSGSPAKNFLMGFGRGYVLRKWSVTTPRRLPAILARDLVICAGQAVIDRNVAGVRGRLRGLRAAIPEYPYPAGLLDGPRSAGLRENLARRLRRRVRLRRRTEPDG